MEINATRALRDRFGLPSPPTSAGREAFALSFATSPFLSPKPFAVLRSLFALWTISVIVVALAIQGVRYGTAGHTFSYFTFLTYWGVMGYFVASAFHTVLYARTGRVPLASWPAALQLAHTILYSTVVSYPILVTIVYWAILSDAATFSTAFWAWENISLHALNTALSLIDAYLLSAAKPPPSLHLPILLLILILYLALAYTTHAVQGWYPYDFLSPQPSPDGVGSRGKVAAYCFGILAAIVAIFGAAKGLLSLKRRWLTKRGLVAVVEHDGPAEERLDIGRLEKGA